MKFGIERAALLRAVAQAQSVVERRNTIPILANILIEAEGEPGGGEVRFRATDLDIEVVDRAPAHVEARPAFLGHPPSRRPSACSEMRTGRRKVSGARPASPALLCPRTHSSKTRPRHGTR